MCTNCNCCNHTCRKKATDDDAGPSEVKKQKKTEEEEGHHQKEEDPYDEETEEGRGKPSSHGCVQHQETFIPKTVCLTVYLTV